MWYGASMATRTMSPRAMCKTGFLFFPAVGANPRSLEDSLVMLRSHGLSFWDALLWATVRAVGCRVLLSEDMQDGRVLGGVTILNPFAEANTPRVNALLVS